MAHKASFLVFILFFLNSWQAIAGSFDFEKLATSSAWLNLLHLSKGKAEVDQKDFYLTARHQGDALDPKEELSENLQAYQKSLNGLDERKFGSLQQTYLCAFPARAEFFRKQLNLTSTSRTCSDFEEWQKGIAAKSLSVIYSSSYAGNPASMFGHTLLRLNKNEESKDLLSYGVNFAAQVGPDENPFKYAAYGVFGGYEGRFTLSPYYMKVNEYHRSESRDLWEYRLNLTSDEVNFAVKHLWELYHLGGFKYYFLDENCSYQVLRILEAIRPTLDLTSEYHSFILPTDTLKPLFRVKDFVKSINVKPSLRKETKRLYLELSESEQKLVDQFKSDLDERLLSEISAVSLEFLLKFNEYQKSKGNTFLSAELLKKVLVARSKKGQVEARERLSIPMLHPEESHASGWLRVDYSKHQNIQIHFSLLSHDLLSRVEGFEPFSQLELMGVRLNYSITSQSLQLSELNILEMTSLSPWDEIEKKWSYHFQVSFQNLNTLRLVGAEGMSLMVVGTSAISYLLLEAETHHKFSSSTLVGLSPRMGFVINLGERVKIQPEFKWENLFSLNRVQHGDKRDLYFKGDASFLVFKNIQNKDLEFRLSTQASLLQPDFIYQIGLGLHF